jgi:hypothetical protein
VKLNSISIGGGLALVAVGLLANAAASLVGSPERTAHADDLKTKRLQAVADVPMSSADEMRRAMDGTPPMMPMGGGDGCVEGEPLNWFGEIRELPECAVRVSPFPSSPQISLIETGNIDLNADHQVECLYSFGGTFGGIVIWQYGNPLPDAAFVAVSQTTIESGFVSVTTRRVISTNEVLPFLAEFSLGGSQFVIATLLGWKDIDGDRDKDCVIRVSVVNQDWTSSDVKFAWLENIGYETPQSLVGDINGDGAVTAEDLALVLGNWTG